MPELGGVIDPRGVILGVCENSFISTFKLNYVQWRSINLISRIFKKSHFRVSIGVLCEATVENLVMFPIGTFVEVYSASQKKWFKDGRTENICDFYMAEEHGPVGSIKVLYDWQDGDPMEKWVSPSKYKDEKIVRLKTSSSYGEFWRNVWLTSCV